MRIAAVAGFAWEPKGTVKARAFPMLASLVRRGHEVILITIPYDNPSMSGMEFAREGVEVVGLRLSAGPWKLFSAPHQAIKKIEAWSPDVVHVFKPKGYSGAIANLLLRRGQFPVCVDLDDWEGWGGWNEVKAYPWLVKEYIDRQERSLTARAHSVTAASRVLEKRALYSGQSGDRLFYVPNCVTRLHFDQLGIAAASRRGAKERFGIPVNRGTILYAGHFEPADDVRFFCRAVKPALEFGAALILVGHGEELPTVREFFSSNPSLDVRYLGSLPSEQYLQALAAADITCFPYPDTPIYRAKCSARILDYLGAGTAVVTTNIGQNPEYIVNGVGGLLCPPGDEAAFSAALLLVLRDPALRETLGRAARQKIGEHFVWEDEAVSVCETAYEMATAGAIRKHRQDYASLISRPTGKRSD
jgi:glycosyltransferase involved in cell wall biosynthesis